MKRGYSRFLSAALFVAGSILLFSPGNSLTGAVIGINEISSTFIPSLGIALVFISFMVILSTEIHSQENEEHAHRRMEERKLFPIVINDVIENGEHYTLKHIKHPENTRGATDAYIKRQTADVAPGDGDIGERIIHVRPDRDRTFQNIIVLTDKNKNIKTAYVKDDVGLKRFMRKYVVDE